MKINVFYAKSTYIVYKLHIHTFVYTQFSTISHFELHSVCCRSICFELHSCIYLIVKMIDDQLYSIQYKRSILLQISSIKRKTMYVQIWCLLPWGSYPAGRVGLSKSRFQGLSRTFPTCRARWLQGRQTRRPRCWPP